MRNFLIVSLVTLVSATSAQASWFQETCTSYEGHTKTQQGHDKNFIVFTKKLKSGKLKKFRLPLHRVSIEYVDHIDLKASSSMGACSPGKSTTVTNWKQLFYRQIKIRKNNGGKFPKNATGASYDRTYIAADTLCTSMGHGSSPCP